MIFASTQLEGAFLIDIKPIKDQHGFFARTWCRQEGRRALIPRSPSGAFHMIGIAEQDAAFISSDRYEETKIVRCVRGATFDVMVDLRPHSSSYLRWQGFDLTAENRRAVYIPKGFAHDYQTLSEHWRSLIRCRQFMRRRLQWLFNL